MLLNVAPPILWTFAGVYIGLGFASLIVVCRPPSQSSELRDRIRSWWVMVLMLSFVLALNSTVAIFFFGWLSFLALREYLSLIPTRSVDRRVLLWSYAAILLQYAWVYIGWYGMFLIFIPIYMFLFLPLRMVLLGETKGFLNAIGTLHWGLMLTVYTISHLAYLRTLPATGSSLVDGIGLVLFLIVLTAINDITQYIIGKWLGRHKITPQVSPNKTVEGFLGGVIITTGGAIALAPWLTPFNLQYACIIGLLLSLAGFIGDVTISALKRDLGIKDSGTLLPGHGGILDRIDSLTYTAPLFFHFTVYFYYRGQWL